MTKASLSALNTSQVPKDLNHTFITLIPNKKDPLHMTDYHPISLCNVLCKLISKVIANHLRTFLPHLISVSQSMYVPVRQITDNSLITYELINFLKKKNRGKKGFMSIKLYMSKAYDHVEWDYLSILWGLWVSSLSTSLCSVLELPLSQS